MKIPNTWIFQGNPTKFDVDSYIREKNEIVWNITHSKYKHVMRIGDIVFLWRSDVGSGRGGIIAKGEFISNPGNFDDPAASKYWLEGRFIDLTIRIRIIDRGFVPRTVLKTDSLLKNLKILHMAQQTNYFLNESYKLRGRTVVFGKEEFNQLIDLWENRQKC